VNEARGGLPAHLVEAADEERRRLEHTCTTASSSTCSRYTLRLRVARARARGDLATLLDEAVADALALNDEVREYAREVYPSVLTERRAGRRHVQAAAARVMPAVHLREFPRRRYPPLTRPPRTSSSSPRSPPRPERLSWPSPTARTG
jgi:hypothetical protein